MRVTSSALLALSISSLAAMANAEEVSQTFVPTQLKTGASSQSEANGSNQGEPPPIGRGKRAIKAR